MLVVRTMSVGTSDQPHQGEMLGGMTAEEVIGMSVVGRDNEEVGEVTDLLIADDGTVDRAIVDVGGFLGFGDKSVALDIASLSLGEGDGELVSDLDAETVEDMPEWQQDDEGWYSE
jgi:sporulation protein YlmC with PRC-barrel domain